MNIILLVLLGCNIIDILYDRVNTSIDFVKKFNLQNEYKIDWLLTGGNKNSTLEITEAQLMFNELNNNAFIKKNNFIIDYNSTNTVENFIFLKKYLNNTINNYDLVYIVTSDFHYERANKISSKVIPKNNFQWILSIKEHNNLRLLEKYYINNIDIDIQKVANFTYG